MADARKPKAGSAAKLPPKRVAAPKAARAAAAPAAESVAPPVRTRYAAPGRDASKRGRAKQRQSFLADRVGDFSADQLAEAMQVRRRAEAAQAAAVTAEAARARGGPRAAPTAAEPHMWLPIGPNVVLQGQASGRPHVAGRVRDLRISPDGQRAYAATANGGVWYTGDGGETWSPLGGWTTTGAPAVPPAAPPPPTIDRPAGVLACGCVHVRFDPGNNPALDEVLVGTGELTPIVRGRPFSRNAGVGVLRGVGPSQAAVFGSPWSLEGKNLSGRGIFRIAADPVPPVPTTFVAATSDGLWTRTGAPAANWTQVVVLPFGDALGNPVPNLICTDAAWAPASGPNPARLWIGVRDDNGGASGLYVSAAGVAGPFTPVPLPARAAAPGIAPIAALSPGSRISLAVAPSNPSVLYALADNNRVWRIDGVLALPVESIPPNLLGGQDAYNQAIAVHPTRPERLVLGGATEKTDGQWSASLYLASVTAPAAGRWRFGFTKLAANADPTTDDSFIGQGVHADVHAARFVTVGARTEVWIGCDGGVFRSLRGNDDNRAAKHSFIARNNGMATLECGYVATHPAVEGHVITGAQDNATLERIGVNLWRRLAPFGDGGSVAFNPAAPHRFVGQVHNGIWTREQLPADPAFQPPVLRTGAAAAAGATESSATAFYTGVDAVRVPGVGVAPATSRLAWGSMRAWLSDDWGITWRTLPSMTDPLGLALPNTTTDPCVLTALGAPDLARGQVIACRWASPTRLYVLCQREVLKYDLPAWGAVTPGAVQALTKQSPAKKESAQAAASVASPGQRLPEVGAWSDIAAHDNSAARGPHGSFYVATTGDPTVPAMDTLWWFNGKDRWHATGLRAAVPAPAYAAVVDRTNPNTVYVGTAVGVWRGVFDPGATHWDWFSMNNGLPEAAVQDISLHDETATGQRLLRAAIQARGIWEVDLANPNLGARTMLRVHAYDTRRQNPTPLIDPKQPAAGAPLSWHASPDLRVRPRRGSRPPAPTGLPWLGAAANPHQLWIFQTALHARAAGDPLVKPDGVWTPLFDARLRAANGGSNRITLALWRTIVGQGAAFPDAYADPWNGATPSEADLFELIHDRAAAAASTASMGLGRVHARVDVQVHHRHGIAVDAANVRVTLLRRDVTGTTDAAWATLPGTWTVPVQALLQTNGAVPALADGWTFADAAQPVRSPGGPVDARLSRVVTFDVDFSALPAGARVLLVAVVHSQGVDAVTLAAGNLQQVVLGNRFVALRSVELL